MSSMKSSLACAFAILCALGSNNVRADSSAFVTFGGLEAALFDLAPDDGIDPAVALIAVERSGSVFQYRFPDAGWPPLREDRVSGVGSTALADANGVATVELRDDSMEGQAVATGGGAYTTLLTDSFRFTLTPHTRVVFSALAESVVSADMLQSALAVVTLAGQIGSLPGEFIIFETSNVRFDSGSSTVPIAVETATAALPLSGDIALRGYAYAAGVSPIPEPATAMMFLAGGMMLALASARRRCRRAIPPARSGFLQRFVLLTGACTLAVGSAALPATAHASSGSASIDDFAYELVDLAPADGIAPSLVFTMETVRGTVNANENNLLGNPWDETRDLAGYGAETIAQQPGRALVELSADAVHASALAWRGAFAASGQATYDFTLTPMTQVIFSAIGQLLVSRDPGQAPGASEASASLSGEFASFPGQRTQFSSFVILNTPGDTMRSLAVHAYTGNLAGTGSIRVGAGAFAVGISPIPEPAPHTMLLAGLGLGWILAPWLLKGARQWRA